MDPKDYNKVGNDPFMPDYSPAKPKTVPLADQMHVPKSKTKKTVRGGGAAKKGLKYCSDD